jgi:hypothetical protein
VKEYIKGEKKQNTKSGLLKIMLLFLAISLSIAGLYFQGEVTMPSKTTVTSGNSMPTSSPPKSEAATAGAAVMTPPVAENETGQDVTTSGSPHPDATTAGAAIIAPIAAGKEDQSELIIAVRVANIRDAENDTSTRISRARKGEKVVKLGSSGGWYQVKLSSGVTGWVRGDLVRESE